MSASEGFNQLHEGVQRWVWQQKWSEFRDIQEQAIEPILKADRDVVISASTAAGKTEAAFLPACSRIATLSPNGVGILYISPLKALINDQYRRLQSLGDILGFPITPWHGDVLFSVKNEQRKKPQGVLLITPESLESLLLNQAGWCLQAFGELSHIIIDEFHAFIGSERGCQLQSLMHRIEFLIKRIAPRIALSATLGDMQSVAQYLRPNKKFPCEIITSTTSHSDLKIQLRGYLFPAIPKDSAPPVFSAIVNDLYTILRGKSHLVFANSRGLTEEITASLSDHCEHDGVPNEFFTHHGNLSKDIRQSVESRLQEGKLPTTAVCTMTLELGIDIGSVESIAQVTAPHSVASLRQRLGRSGRRGEAAILRMFIPEMEVTPKNHVLDRLRLQTFQCVAMVNLLLKKWYEPPAANQYHFSTLVQQTLSVIGQYGGVRARQLWSLLCGSGPFSMIDQKLYGKFLRALSEQDLISQTQDGQIILGCGGEKIIEHYTFYTAFNTPEEYRLECEGQILGSIPIDKPLTVEQLIIFAGKRWKVLHVDASKKLILLERAFGGRPPNFEGGGQTINDTVRQEMFRMYKHGAVPVYLDKNARIFFSEGVDCFRALELHSEHVVQCGDTIHIFPWLGDRIVNTITALFRREKLSANCFGGLIDISHGSKGSFMETVNNILQKPKPTSAELASNIPNTVVEKHDIFLSKEMRDINYGARFFDVDGAWGWLNSIAR